MIFKLLKLVLLDMSSHRGFSFTNPDAHFLSPLSFLSLSLSQFCHLAVISSELNFHYSCEPNLCSFLNHIRSPKILWVAAFIFINTNCCNMMSDIFPCWYIVVFVYWLRWDAHCQPNAFLNQMIPLHYLTDATSKPS